MKYSKGILALSVLSFVVFPLQAKVVLPAHFTDNMVLQQQTTLRIPGKTLPGKKVVVTTSWNKKQESATAGTDGKFSVMLKTPKAGGPYTLCFDDGEQTKLQNVLVGEVWLGGGQSNMDMEINGWSQVLNYEEEVANANYPKIRLLEVKMERSLQQEENVKVLNGGWRVCSPESVPEFSACCFFFARKLWQELKVPIGVIDDCVGGTPAEYWTRTEVLASIKGFEKEVKTTLQMDNAKADAIISQFDSICATVDLGSEVHGKWYERDFDDSQWPTMKIPTHIENYVGNIDGAVWVRKHIQIPSSWIGKEVVVSLGTVDDANVTFWNGKEIGRLNSYPEKSTYIIPASDVQNINNVLCVRVYDSDGGGGIIDKPELLFLACGDDKITLEGEWLYQLGVNQKDVPTIPRPYDRISSLWNAMIAPLTDFPIRGVIWYQGCANVGRAAQYEPLFQAMIQDWRVQFHQPEMPFYLVQLANFQLESDLQPNSQWALLREAQSKATCLKGVEMTSAIDIGEAADIHPRNKQEVGLRLALLALHHQYGKKVACTAPRYKGYKIVGKEVHIQFEAPEGSEPFLQADSLPGFIMAGIDQQWHVAKARTQGQEIIVTCDNIEYPMAVRYGWADNPKCILHTKHHFPVFPFRTDAW